MAGSDKSAGAWARRFRGAEQLGETLFSCCRRTGMSVIRKWNCRGTNEARPESISNKG
jgi:hypothetical protein